LRYGDFNLLQQTLYMGTSHVATPMNIEARLSIII